MKKIINIYTNWRVDALMGIMLVGLILLFAECESFASLVWAKLGAVACGFAFAGLFAKWEAEGKIKELSDLCKEED